MPASRRSRRGPGDATIVRHTPRDGGPVRQRRHRPSPRPGPRPNFAFHRLMRLDRRRFARAARRGPRHPPGLVEHRRRFAGGDLHRAPLAAQLAGASRRPPASRSSTWPRARPPPWPAASASICWCRRRRRSCWRAHHPRDGGRGPFIDLTAPFDAVRRQPVVEIDRITHRADPIYQALLPGAGAQAPLWHAARAAIFEAVSQVAIAGTCSSRRVARRGCTAVVHTQGVAGRWPAGRRGRLLTATLPEARRRVDDDVDIHDPAAVEWAIATRLQADRDVMILERAASSSLDPSAHQTSARRPARRRWAWTSHGAVDTDAGPRDPAVFRRVDYFREAGR